MTPVVTKRSLEMLSQKHSQQSPRKQITHLKVREERIPVKHIPLLPTEGAGDSQLGPHEFCAFAGFSASAFGCVKAKSLPQHFCPSAERDEEYKRQQL